MRHLRTPLALAMLLLLAAGPLTAQSASIQPKYLVATAHYLNGEAVDLTALPEPPKLGSLAAAADLETILQLQTWRSAEQVAWAKRKDQLGAFDPAEVLGAWFSRERLPKCAVLLEEALGDGEGLNHVAKLKFKRLRPPFQDSRVQPCLPVFQPSGTPTAGYYSYPSGHATSSYLLAELLAELVPARREQVWDWARQVAWSRMLAGVHFPSDNLGGRVLAGMAIRALKANPAFLAALVECQAEVLAAQGL